MEIQKFDSDELAQLMSLMFDSAYNDVFDDCPLDPMVSCVTDGQQWTFTTHDEEGNSYTLTLYKSGLVNFDRNGEYLHFNQSEIYKLLYEQGFML